MIELTEDEVRNSAGGILGFTIIGPNGEMINVDTEQIHSGVGQLTTFIQLGKKLKISEFNGFRDKPDGWYFPTNFGKPAIVLETKSSSEDIRLQKWADELQKNMNIVAKKYSKVVGILWNGIDQRIFVNDVEMSDVANTLQNKEYYISLCVNDKIDKMHIYDVTKRINDNLAFNFGMTDLQDRMIFTACALVAQRYFPVPGLKNLKNMGYNTFKNWIFDSLSKAITEDKRQNEKLDVLLDTYSTIKISIEKQDSINKFIDDVCEISELVNSNNWNGEDKKYGNKILKDHTLKTIIKMPENLFLNGTTPSIFIFEAGRPQGNDNIIGYYIEDDGLETVKNKGRQDIKNRWEEKEDYWVKAIHDGNDYLYNTRQIINPKEHLSYQLPEKPFEITEEDFTKTVLNYMMFEDGIDVKEFNEKILTKVVYGSAISSTDDSVQIIVDKSSDGVKMNEEKN